MTLKVFSYYTYLIVLSLVVATCYYLIMYKGTSEIQRWTAGAGHYERQAVQRKRSVNYSGYYSLQYMVHVSIAYALNKLHGLESHQYYFSLHIVIVVVVCPNAHT